MKERLKMKTVLLFLGILVNIAIVKGQNDPKPPEGMVYVPPGQFIMGSEYGDPDERPKQIDTTAAFFIDKNERATWKFLNFLPLYFNLKSFIEKHYGQNIDSNFNLNNLSISQKNNLNTYLLFNYGNKVEMKRPRFVHVLLFTFPLLIT